MSDRPKSNRGGVRRGAGRKPKPEGRLKLIDLKAALAQPAPDEIEILARSDGAANIEAMIRQMQYGESASTAIKCAKHILDRAYGKPGVDIGGDAWLPFQSAPLPAATEAACLREKAKAAAPLAVAVLRQIRDHDKSESARIEAAIELDVRGYGKPAQARMPDELKAKPLGKKEELHAAAQTAATGRYKTPAPPVSATHTIQ